VFWHFGDKEGCSARRSGACSCRSSASSQSNLEHIPPRERVFEILSAYERVVDENEAAIRSFVRWLLESEKLRASLRETLFALHDALVKDISDTIAAAGTAAGDELGRRSSRCSTATSCSRCSIRTRATASCAARACGGSCSSRSGGRVSSALLDVAPNGLDARELAPEACSAGSAARTFPVALRWLPAALRRDLTAVYGAARLIDEAGDAASGDRAALLDESSATCSRVRGRARHPLLQRLTPLAAGARRHARPVRAA
jgi:hypothetical protein